MSQFAFLRREWPEVFDSARRAEAIAHADPRTSCFYARRTLELAVAWVYKYDSSLKAPYQDNLSALIHEPSFKRVAGEAVFNKARVINTLGNRAVHGPRPVPLQAVREIFHVCYWLARTYARGERPARGVEFHAPTLPGPTTSASHRRSRTPTTSCNWKHRFARRRSAACSAASASRAVSFVGMY